MKKLATEYKEKRHKIKQRLSEFEEIGRSAEKNVFSELCFCILTPQSKAVYCDKAIKNLKKSGLLFNGSQKSISKALRGFARFHNKKASYLLAARNIFCNGRGLRIKSKLNEQDKFKTRDWLVENIKGLGYKEASHFLRNVGLGNDMAILDVHILKNLKMWRIINKIPSSLTRKNYLSLEDTMRNFARKVEIPLEELDLLLWSRETGFIFK